MSSGSQSLDLGDAWRYGCPNSPDWDSDVESWTESEGTSSEQCEHNVESVVAGCDGARTSQAKRCLSSWKVGACEVNFELPLGS